MQLLSHTVQVLVRLRAAASTTARRHSPVGIPCCSSSVAVSPGGARQNCQQLWNPAVQRLRTPPSLDVPHCDGSTSQAARHWPSLHNRPLTHVMTEQASTHWPPTYVVVRIRIPKVVHDVIGMGRRRDLVRVGLRREVRPPADEHRLGRLRSGGRRDGQHRRRHCGNAQEGRELRSHAHHTTIPRRVTVRFGDIGRTPTHARRSDRQHVSRYRRASPTTIRARTRRQPWSYVAQCNTCKDGSRGQVASWAYVGVVSDIRRKGPCATSPDVRLTPTAVFDKLQRLGISACRLVEPRIAGRLIRIEDQENRA